MNKSNVIENAALGLVKLNTTTTTLDVKEFLRTMYPTETWTQADVSNVLANCAALTYTDNGTFRTYYANNHTVVSKTSTTANTTTPVYHTISKTRMVDLIRNTAGQFFTVTFAKKNGDVRILNGQVKKNPFMTNLGNIMVTEVSGKKQRQFDPKRLISFSFNGEKYVTK